MTQSATIHSADHPGLALARALRAELFAPAPADLSAALARASAVDPGPFDPDDPEPGGSIAAAPVPTLEDHTTPVVTQLALTLALARALGAAGITRVDAAAGITRIGGWGLGAADTLKVLMQKGPVADALCAAPARLKVFVDGAPRDETARDAASTRRRLRGDIDAALSAGRAVVLIGADDTALAPSHGALVTGTLTLPRPDQALMAALFAVLWPGHPCLADATAALPADEGLARLVPVQLEAALRRPDPGAAATALAQVVARMVPEAAGPGLEAIVGQPGLVQVLGALARDVAALRAGGLDWSTVPRSVLLSGPPGNGKTAAARALAAECKVPLVTTSFSEAQGEGLHLGQTLAALKTAFDSAMAQAPAILFVDEIDAIGTRQHHAGRNDFYVRAIVTGMLTMIDRALRTPGLILVGATNDIEAMDPALRRAGRFDTHLHIPAPAQEALGEILARALGDAAETIGRRDLQSAARRLAGSSGADAEALGRQVLARARAAGRPATATDLAACLADYAPAPAPRDLRRVALHESAHIVVGHVEGLPPPRRASASLRGAGVEHPVPPLMTLREVEATLVTLLAGRAIEALMCGDISTGSGQGPDSDLAEATRLALHVDHAWHLDPETPLLWSDVSAPPRPGQLPRAIAEAVSRRLARADARARDLVAQHMDVIEAIASVLFRDVELDARQISDLLIQFLPDEGMLDDPAPDHPDAPPCA